MAVYVRDLTRAEGNRLMEIARRGKNPIAVRRAQVLIASDQGMKAPEIPGAYHLSPDYVRIIIHRYNREGFESVHAKYENGGRPPKFTPEECSLILEIANIPPKIIGLPFTHWSLMKLRDHLVKCRIVAGISHEQLRQILKRANWSLQRVKTWKESNDREFESKKRIKWLYKKAPKGGRVICLDEFGPLELRPVGGATWSPKKEPDRNPATYTRPDGVRHMLACYDLESDTLYGSIQRRKRNYEVLAFLKTIRKRYPMTMRIYIVLDNFPPHLHRRVREWTRKNRVSLVFTPTNASWLNRIECHFGVLRKFVLHNSHYQSHEELADAIHRYIRWRNANAKDKRILRIQKRYDFS